jgi:hypothetical protein
MTHTFKLERLDGTPADPPSFKPTVLVWQPGDTIPIGRDGTLRVVDVRPGAGRRRPGLSRR